MRILLLFAALVTAPLATVRAWEWWTGAGRTASPVTQDLATMLAERETCDRASLRER
jgi:hypothetical protein